VSDFTPNTDQVRRAYSWVPTLKGNQRREEEFDRWLEAFRTASVDEGYHVGYSYGFGAGSDDW
jgi:hypothetical protein